MLITHGKDECHLSTLLECGNCHWTGYHLRFLDKLALDVTFDNFSLPISSFSKACPQCKESFSVSANKVLNVDSNLFNVIDNKKPQFKNILSFDEVFPLLFDNKEKITDFYESYVYYNIINEGVYRFHSQSFKTYRLNVFTAEAFVLLSELSPTGFVDSYYSEIAFNALSRRFDMSDNKNWVEQLSPVVSAALHSDNIFSIINKILNSSDAYDFNNHACLGVIQSLFNCDIDRG